MKLFPSSSLLQRIRPALTIPNMISLSRLLLSWPLAHTMYHGYFYTVIFLGSLAILSDFLDGYLSRLLNQHSAFGRALDPIVDCIMVISVLTSLYLKEKIPFWYIQCVIGRYFIISMVVLFYRHKTKRIPGSIPSGKWSMVGMALVLFLGWLQSLFPQAYQVSLNLSMGLMALSLLDYLYTYGYRR